MFFKNRVMYELHCLFVKIQSNRKPIDAGLIMYNSFIAKKLDIVDEDLLLIPELYISAVSCFGMWVITKNMALI